MTKQFLDLIKETEKIAEKAKQTFGFLNSEQLNRKLSAESWSIGQCFEHLIVTNKLYFPNIQRVINGKHQNNFFSKIPFAVDLIAVLMKNSLKPEQKRKMKTFKIFEPSLSNISETIIEDFAENQRILIDLMKNLESFDVHQIKISEPLSMMLNLRLKDAFEILILHEERHFQQAQRVLKILGFLQ
jgi:plasmid rolling circle replication initiator protein Rep